MKHIITANITALKDELEKCPEGLDIEFSRYFMKEIVGSLRENLKGFAVFIVVDPDDTHDTFTVSVAKTQRDLDKRESRRQSKCILKY